MHPYSRASMASAFSNRALILNGTLDLSKSSVENFLKHPQAILVRRLISRVGSASLVMRPPRYTSWWTRLYFWPAAAISSPGRGGVGVFSGCCAFSGARIRKVSNGRSLDGMGLTRERWCCAGCWLSRLDMMNTCQTSIKSSILLKCCRSPHLESTLIPSELIKGGKSSGQTLISQTRIVDRLLKLSCILLVRILY